jgi:tyrosyl-tRNA synthetase
MTMPILTGTDGTKKMSKSYGNYIALNDTSKDMFGKIMSITDDLMFDYFRLLTDIPVEEINEYKIKINENKLHPRDLKEKLAKLIVTDYFGEKTAQFEADEFKKVFAQNKDPENVPEFEVDSEFISDGKSNVMNILKSTGAFKSNGEIKRLIKQGAVKFNNEKINDMNQLIKVKSGILIKIGKHRFFKIK